MPGETQEDPDCVDLTLSDTEELDEEAFEDVDVAEKTGSSTDNLYASLYDAVPDGDATPEAAMLEDIRHATTQAPSIQITWAQSKSKAASRTRTATTTPQDRKNRVLVHQLHVLSILAATRLRNRWCNDEALRDTLQEAVPDILLRQLQAIHPKLVPERRERVRMFEAFMHELVEWWHVRFYVKAGVAASAAWRQPQLDLWQPQPISPPAWIDGWCAETPKGRTQRHRRESKTKKKAMEVAICPTGPTTSVPTYLYLLPPPESTSSAHGLRQAARGRVGSRETKAILFCALCRSLGIPARLVVSVQVCPYSAAKTSARPWAQGSAHEGGSLYIEPLDEKTPPTVWVEVYSKPYQHWLTVDPVRGFVKATGLRNMEPLPAQRQNKMVYVVAFEEDGYARDVTARYTRTLYSRVMRQRPTPRGVDWWANVVKALHRPQKLDRDAVEDVELEDNARREPMPTSVNGFKDHAVFALERHLLRDQVIHPMHRVGTFQGQPVYLRAHVLTLQSARQWYNQGREVKPDEVPLKWAKPRAYTTLNKRLEEQARASGNDVQEGLFAEFQTRRYIPPAVEHGRVPCNAFGNVDLFVPSMLPRGGTHIPHALAARAAKHVGVHYGDAVVGFEFRRFRSLPKLQGIVVPRESADLVRAVRRMQPLTAGHRRTGAPRSPNGGGKATKARYEKLVEAADRPGGRAACPGRVSHGSAHASSRACDA